MQIHIFKNVSVESENLNRKLFILYKALHFGIFYVVSHVHSVEFYTCKCIKIRRLIITVYWKLESTPLYIFFVFLANFRSIAN